MHSLFIGQTYIDVTILADAMPAGDDKAVARDYAVSFGGNAVTAGFCAARLGHSVDMLTSLSDDWLGRMFLDMAAKYQISVHGRKVKRSSLSVVLPSAGKRAILRARDDEYLHPLPNLNIAGINALHLDGHQADAAMHYAKLCRQMGVMTSLDGGGLRSNTHDLLGFIDVAICSTRLCEQMNMNGEQLLNYLKGRGCKIGGVTEGEHGMLWYDEGGEVQRLPALDVPSSLVIDTSGAGDVFHGSYVAAYLDDPSGRWIDHFRFARAASAFKVQHLGNEAGLPAREDVARMREKYEEG